MKRIGLSSPYSRFWGVLILAAIVVVALTVLLLASIHQGGLKCL